MEDIYYYYVQPEERLRISNLLREELEFDQISFDELNLSDADLQFGFGDNGTLEK